MVKGKKHVDTLHEEGPVEVRRNTNRLLLELEEPACRHLHSLPNSGAIELMRLAKSDANDGTKHSRVAAIRAHRFD